MPLHGIGRGSIPRWSTKHVEVALGAPGEGLGDGKSSTKLYGSLAQLGEHSTVTAEVRGSKPLRVAKLVRM